MRTTNRPIIDVLDKLQELEAAIQTEAERKKKAEAEIERCQGIIRSVDEKLPALRAKISFLREMGGLAVPATMPSPATVERQEQSPIRGALPNAIEALLDAQPNKDFQTTETAEMLVSQGFPTKSKEFKNVVRNTLSKMAGHGTIKSRADGQSKKYWSRKREDARLI